MEVRESELRGETQTCFQNLESEKTFELSLNSLRSFSIGVSDTERAIRNRITESFMINTFMIHKHQTTPGDSERRNQGSDLLFVMMLKPAGGGRKRNTENPRHIPEERKNKTSSER